MFYIFTNKGSLKDSFRTASLQNNLEWLNDCFWIVYKEATIHSKSTITNQSTGFDMIGPSVLKELRKQFFQKTRSCYLLICIYTNLNWIKSPVDTGRKLNAHKMFRRRPGRYPNVLRTFNLRPVSTGIDDRLLNCQSQILCSNYLRK